MAVVAVIVSSNQSHTVRPVPVTSEDVQVKEAPSKDSVASKASEKKSESE